MKIRIRFTASSNESKSIPLLRSSLRSSSRKIKRLQALQALAPSLPPPSGALPSYGRGGIVVHMIVFYWLALAVTAAVGVVPVAFATPTKAVIAEAQYVMADGDTLATA